MLKIRAVESALALIAFTVCVSSAMQASAPGLVQTGTVTVTGRVTTSDGKPVANARVYIPGTNEATRTDAKGNYALSGVPGGPQEVVVRQRGYAPVQVDAKFSTKPSDRARNHVDVKLLTPSELATNTAQSARDSAALDKVGFFRRESSSGRNAYFITPDQIAEMKPSTTSDVFRQVPILTQTIGRTGPVLRGAQGCLLTYVDGFPWRSMFPGDLDTYIPVRDVVAAEVYPPGQVAPPPFARGAPRSSCTTLGIWTRSRLG